MADPRRGRGRSQPPDLAWESRLWNEGFRWIAGVDEAGRGALAGSVVAAAVIIPVDADFSPLIRDSKTLSARQREEAVAEIQEVALSIGIGLVDAAGVDHLNIRRATRLAMLQAVEALWPPADCLLVDAEPLDSPLPQHVLVRGDQLSQAIAAASIVAKVTRDRMAQGWHARFPQYGFSRHKGYATRDHLAALQALGPCPLHRRTFLRKIPGQTVLGQQELWPSTRSS